MRGPNRTWLVDGHNKLLEYGFQIYGIIDAYSRYVVGCYVGISNRTQIAVQKFYL
jgi:transposase InsO family protein